MSYRCLPNVKATIAKHNSKLLNQSGPSDKTERCCCRDPAECPLPNKCAVQNVVYQATVSTQGSEDDYYVGLTSRPFKTRYGEHKGDFSNEERKHATRLATHIWDLKGGGKDPQISWKVVCKAAPYSPITGICNLCTSEKWNIIFKPESATLNARQEIFNHCRHKQKSLLTKKKKK